VWPEPTLFHPERFIDDNGCIVGKERVIPFSVGEVLDYVQQTKSVFVLFLHKFMKCPSWSIRMSCSLSGQILETPPGKYPKGNSSLNKPHEIKTPIYGDSCLPRCSVFFIAKQ
jgi:hypothetical protein